MHNSKPFGICEYTIYTFSWKPQVHDQFVSSFYSVQLRFGLIFFLTGAQDESWYSA